MGEQKTDPRLASEQPARRRTSRTRVAAAVALTNTTAFFGGAVVREPRLALPALGAVLLWSTVLIGLFTWIQLTLVRRGAELARSVEEVRSLMDTGVLAFTRLLDRPGRRARRTAEPREGPRFTGQHAAILLVDVVGFGSPARTDADRELIVRVLYDTVRLACAQAGIPWYLCHREDRGDGLLMVLPVHIPARTALSPFLDPLANLLQRHNRRAEEGTRLQLRAALHVGPVTSVPDGVTGEAIIHTARLLDARPAKEEQRATGADLAFVASALVYETIIRHAPDDLRPDSYRRFTARVKESEVTGWLCLPGAQRRAVLLQLEELEQLGPRTYTTDRLPEELA